MQRYHACRRTNSPVSFIKLFEFYIEINIIFGFFILCFIIFFI